MIVYKKTVFGWDYVYNKTVDIYFLQHKKHSVSKINISWEPKVPPPQINKALIRPY